MVANATLKLRGDTAANWTAANPVLALNEPGIETDTRKLKYGDGATAWTTLAYSAAGGGTVTSVSVTTANGVSGTVATATTTPALTLTLAAITPTTIVATGAVSGTNLSGTNTGDQTITLTGNVTGTGTGSFATTIAANVVTNAMLAQVATGTFQGRITAATGNVETLTGTQATSLLDPFSSTLKGLAPLSGGGTANFLRADGTWAAPAGGGGFSYTVVNKTAGYTETTTSGCLIIEANLAAGFTITLPTAVGNAAQFVIKKMLAAGQITVATTSAQTIDGGATAVLNNLSESITIISNNANWDIM